MHGDNYDEIMGRVVSHAHPFGRFVKTKPKPPHQITR